MNELQKYYEEYSDIFARKSNDDGPWLFFNSDRAHNAIVMRIMLENSSQIDMFCHDMSVFRPRFYNEIENEGSKEFLRNGLEDGLRSFSKRNGVLNVIIENANEFVMPEALVEHNIQVNVYKLKSDISNGWDLMHFSVSDSDIFRNEIDKNAHNAICSYWDVERCKTAKDNFNTLKKYSTALS